MAHPLAQSGSGSAAHTGPEQEERGHSFYN